MIPLFPELPGSAAHPAALPGPDVPARHSPGAARAPHVSGGEITPPSPTALPETLLPVPLNPPGGAGTDGAAVEDPRPPARRALGAGNPTPRLPGRSPQGTVMVPCWDASPFPADSPSQGSGEAPGPAGSARSSAALPAARKFDDAPVPPLRLEAPEPGPEAA